MEGANDWDLAALAAERDYVIVTNNRRNFMRVYGRLEIHDGLIIIVPTVSSNEQVRLFEAALDIAGQQDSLVNVVIEVSADGTVGVRNWAGESLAGEG